MAANPHPHPHPSSKPNLEAVERGGVLSRVKALHAALDHVQPLDEVRVRVRVRVRVGLRVRVR